MDFIVYAQTNTLTTIKLDMNEVRNLLNVPSQYMNTALIEFSSNMNTLLGDMGHYNPSLAKVIIHEEFSRSTINLIVATAIYITKDYIQDEINYNNN